MNDTKRLLTLLLSLCFVGCVGSLDRTHPPARDSALLTPLSESVATDTTIVDRMRSDLVWYDATRDQIVRLANDAVVPLQDRHVRSELGAAPTQLRAFADGSALVVTDGLYALPADGSAAIAIAAPVYEAIDGVSIEDFWAGGWALSTGELPGLSDDYGACHFVAHALTSCVAFPNVGGYDGVMAVTSDGSVYMTDRDVSLYRYDGTSVLMVDSLGDFVTGFRRSGGAGLLAITYMSGAYAIEGEHARRVTDGGYINDLAGAPDDFYFSRYDSYSENVDPSCHGGFFSSCEQRTVWFQMTIWHVTGGSTSEVGHEDCTDAMEPACAFGTLALGVDGDHGVVLGSPIRRTE